MLRSVDELRGYVLTGKDGDLGRCRDFLFDDRRWNVRYMVADIRRWIPGRRVLVPPAALRPPDWAARHLPVALTSEQFEAAAAPAADPPVSKRLEGMLARHSSWALPMVLAMPVSAPAAGGHPPALGTIHAMGVQDEALDPDAGDPHLRSAAEVLGYRIQADDDAVGRVDDLVVDDCEWIIRWLVIDTGSWLPGRKVLISPNWIHRFDWHEKSALVDLSREQIENSPEFGPARPIHRAYEARIYERYGRPGHWKGADPTGPETHQNEREMQ